MRLLQISVFLCVFVWVRCQTEGSNADRVTFPANFLDRPSSDLVGKNETTEEALGCGRHFIEPGTSKIFKSRNYPDLYKKSKCTWNFRTSKKARLNVVCEDFRLEQSTNCKKDYFEINDYVNKKRRVCGLQKMMRVSESTFKLQVKFKANKKNSFKGFKCIVEATKSAIVPKVACESLSCGSHYVAPGTSLGFQSENYPNNYPSNHRCRWDFNTDALSTITIECSDFSLERSKNCRKDYLSILDTWYCGSYDSLNIPTDRPSVSVSFQTNRRKSSSGFCCSATASEPGTTPPPQDCSCGQANRAQRIVGGVETEVNEYPWMAGLIRNGYFICGGSIIADDWILTAAHCAVIMSENDKVFIGEHSLSSVSQSNVKEISRIIIHPNYDDRYLDSDIALLKLESRITFPDDNTISTICLPTAGEVYSDVNAIVTGWGAQTEGGGSLPELYEVEVPTITNQECKNAYQGSITDNMICAGVAGKDSCQGDSGGPMFYFEDGRYVQIGIVSWGIGCARDGYPGVYTRVNNFLTWIEDNISSSGKCSS